MRHETRDTKHSMRPNVDIPDGLHGRIKEFKKTSDHVNSLDDAYHQLLAESLDDALSTRATESEDFDRSTPGFFQSTPTAGVGINSGQLFSANLLTGDLIRSHSRLQESLSSDEFRELLIALGELVGERNDYPDLQATMSQVDGEWHVGSASEIHSQLCDVVSRWESQPDWNIHRKELVTISGRSNGDEMIFITAECDERHTTTGQSEPQLRNCELSVITDGYPVTGDNIATYAKRLGFPVPEVANSITIPSQRQNDPVTSEHTPISLSEDDIIAPITYSEGPLGSRDTPWVCGLCVENPFNRHQLDRHFRPLADWEDKAITELLARDQIVVNNLDHHPLDDPDVGGYSVKRIRLQDVTAATGGLSGTIYNTNVDIRYEEASEQSSSPFVDMLGSPHSGQGR